jgi:Fe-S-cluster-containing dehydrogenase component/DMSO reductase anchor subunit
MSEPMRVTRETSPKLRDLRTIKHLPVLSVNRKLEEQRKLTAVERFAERHESGDQPAQAKYYRSLLPSTEPRPGQQYSFEVDLDRCTGCKACVSACHSLNGLDENELWRKVGTIQSLDDRNPRIQTVTSSCHHCVEPACMKGCPTGAYEKSLTTGIVKHLDDQCFGCQYCTLMCPYDAPKFSASRGIVRKCDMCSQRLDDGEAPACVQACPNEAIAIRIVEQKDITRAAFAGDFIAGAPDPKATEPTTRYLSSRMKDITLVAVDRDETKIEHTHLPLVIMLTLTQLGVGTLLFSFGFYALGLGNALASAVQPSVALLVTLVALAASVFHLGRPLLAWRAILNLKTSWLSREALAFGFFAKALGLFALSYVPSHLIEFPGIAILEMLRLPLAIAAGTFGLTGVFCSVMVYVATQRAHWAWNRTSFAFFGTLILLGAACTAVVMALTTLGHATPAASVVISLLVLIAAASTKLLFEHRHVRHTKMNSPESVVKMAKTIRERLSRLDYVRATLGVVGGILLPLVLLADVLPTTFWPAIVITAFSLLLVGELLERTLFFCAAPASRMPGALP